MENPKIQPIISVSDFIAVVNQTLEYAYPEVMIEGEIASFKISQGKFAFFDIKDQGGSVGCFMSVWQLRVPIQDGMKVIISVVPKLTGWGKFSLTVKTIRPSGEGSLKKSFELLKEKLNLEGLFAVERKRRLPIIPDYIAIVSSTQSAGYADFIKILGDRWGGVKIDVAHVQVQGADAPDQMIRAINYFNQQESLPQVLVIIRGGGSVDDLSAFNDELLVRAIAGSRIPTLVGVGHETDESLVDLAADVSASTPSNAAQILVPDRKEIIRSIRVQHDLILSRMLHSIDKHSQLISDNLNGALETIRHKIDENMTYVSNLKKVLMQLDPRAILARGYALIRGTQKIGSMVEIETNKVILEAEVINVVNK
jgi:exodeoxyribonuclease VII large subunit